MVVTLPSSPNFTFVHEFSDVVDAVESACAVVEAQAGYPNTADVDHLDDRVALLRALLPRALAMVDETHADASRLSTSRPGSRSRSRSAAGGLESLHTTLSATGYYDDDTDGVLTSVDLDDVHSHDAFGLSHWHNTRDDDLSTVCSIPSILDETTSARVQELIDILSAFTHDPQALALAQALSSSPHDAHMLAQAEAFVAAHCGRCVTSDIHKAAVHASRSLADLASYFDRDAAGGSHGGETGVVVEFERANAALLALNLVDVTPVSPTQHAAVDAWFCARDNVISSLEHARNRLDSSGEEGNLGVLSLRRERAYHKLLSKARTLFPDPSHDAQGDIATLDSLLAQVSAFPSPLPRHYPTDLLQSLESAVSVLRERVADEDKRVRAAKARAILEEERAARLLRMEEEKAAREEAARLESLAQAEAIRLQAARNLAAASSASSSHSSLPSSTPASWRRPSKLDPSELNVKYHRKVFLETKGGGAPPP